MIETGGKPILWHMVKIHLFYVIYEFIIYPGHKSYTINFFLHQSDINFDKSNNDENLIPRIS
jgi:glucose-1-phosphate cytidylyltransferase